MQPIIRNVLVILSLALLSVYVSVNAEQYVLSLKGSMTFCRTQEVINPNKNSQQGKDIRLAYSCKGGYAVSFIAIDYESTPFDGCYVNLHNIKNLCYTSQLHNQGEGLTIKAGNCLDFPGQQLWNFEKAGDESFKIHPKGRTDLCLTSVQRWYRGDTTAPLSLQPCFNGASDATNAFRDTWNSECGGRRFENFTCSQFDPSVNCGIKG